MTRQERLSAHVAAIADKPVEWGVDDCSAWAAGWIRRSGFDLVTPIYHSEAAARRLTVTFNGGDALTIKTASGDDVPVGGLLTSVLGRVVGMTFCLLMSNNDEAISITTANARTAVQAAATATTKASEAAGHEESARTSAASAADSAEKAAAAAGGGVMTFNMRSPTNGNISPESGDYTAACSLPAYPMPWAMPSSSVAKVATPVSSSDRPPTRRTEMAALQRTA